jgi:GntR family transcriptional regulator
MRDVTPDWAVWTHLTGTIPPVGRPEERTVGKGLSAADVAQLISATIAAESLQPGDRIGAERELAERYGVSRWLVRQALGRLEAEQVVLRTNGRSGGVFVSTKKVVRDLHTLLGLTQYLQAQGLESGTTVLGTRAGPAEDEVVKELGISPDAWVFQVDRLRLAGGLPLSVESMCFPAELFPGLLDQSLVGPLYEVLENQYGVRRGEAVETITATAADRRNAATLQVSVGSPLLAVARTARLETGEIFEVSKEFYRADRIAITVHTTGTDGAQRSVV